MKKGSYGSQNGFDRPARKQGAVGAGDTAEFRGYINLNLSDEQKAAYDTWASSGSLWEALEAQVESGVNVSLKRDAKSGGFLASATQRDPLSPNAGLVVTARGKLAQVAWGRVLFCLTILSHSERWEDTQPLANPDRW
jgi:hypothetical protein